MPVNPAVVEKVHLPTHLMSPRILYCHLFKGSDRFEKGTKLGPRHVRNYEIEYFLSGGGGMWINEDYHTVKKGDIVFRKPGDFTQALMPYDCYCIFFCFRDDDTFSASNFDIYSDKEFEKLYTNDIIDGIPTHFYPVAGEKYFNMFDSVLNHFINPSPCSDLLVKSCILQIISHVFEDCKNPFNQTASVEPSHFAMIKKTIEFIHSHMDEELTLQILSREANLSPSYFHTIFHRIAGVTLNEYIVKIRMEKSKEMLLKTRYSITEVALRCGFGSLSYFSFLFKKKLGMSPAEFRKKHNVYQNTTKKESLKPSS